MTRNELRQTTQPFRPFTLTLTSGDTFFIPHTDFLMFPPEIAGNLVIAVDSTGGIHLVDTSQIVSLNYQKV